MKRYGSKMRRSGSVRAKPRKSNKARTKKATRTFYRGGFVV